MSPIVVGKNSAPVESLDTDGSHTIGIMLVNINDVVNTIILIFTLNAAVKLGFVYRIAYIARPRPGRKGSPHLRKGRLKWTSLISATVFCSLAFLSVNSSSATGGSSVCACGADRHAYQGALTWMATTYTHICVGGSNADADETLGFSRFMSVLKAQGVSRNTLPCKAPLQPCGCWLALICTGIMTLFKGEWYR
jgi:amino acid transporter